MKYVKEEERKEKKRKWTNNSNVDYSMWILSSIQMRGCHIKWHKIF